MTFKTSPTPNRPTLQKNSALLSIAATALLTSAQVLAAAPAPATTPATTPVTTPATTLPASWNAASLSGATYVVANPRIDGNASLISKDQQDSVLAALQRDSAGAIKRHYPNAQIATDPNTPGAIKVTPVLVAPASLTPWAKLDARMEIQLPDTSRVTLVNTFGVLTLWQQGANAANYAFDQLAQKLP